MLKFDFDIDFDFFFTSEADERGQVSCRFKSIRMCDQSAWHYQSVLSRRRLIFGKKMQAKNENIVSIANFNTKLEATEIDIECCTLSVDSVQVSAVVYGYTVRKVLIDRHKHKSWQELSIATDAEKSVLENAYLNKLSRGGLIVSSSDMRDYISKSFAILNVCHKLMKKS